MIDFGGTKSKFPGLASGKPHVVEEMDDGDDAEAKAAPDDDAESEGGDTKSALASAESALEKALAAVRAAMK